MFGASLYAPGRVLVSGAALESGMQHCALKQKFMLPIVNFHDLVGPHIKLVGGSGGCWPWLAVSSALVLAKCGVRGR